MSRCCSVVLLCYHHFKLVNDAIGKLAVALWTVLV